jgi:hypothetical protein
MHHTCSVTVKLGEIFLSRENMTKNFILTLVLSSQIDEICTGGCVIIFK